jgi:uncharacterized membrane protein
MKKYLLLYLAIAIVLAVLDGVWLGVVAKDYFRSRLGHLMLPEVNLWVAAVFYLIYPVGVLIFATNPALANGSWTTALLYGALFGFFAYATYDLTNLATLRGWPLSVVMLDVSWGTLVTGVSAAAAFLISNLVVRAAS